MTTFQLKILAIITMVIDHVGLFFFPDIIWFRVVGRLSFPLFAWLIAEGASHTKNIKAYLARLLIFAVISQAPFYFANRLANPTFSGLNVLFTLFLGLSVIAVIKKLKDGWLQLLAVFVGLMVAAVLNTDYGTVGVLAVVFFYLFKKDVSKMVIFQTLIFAIPAAVNYTQSPYVQNIIQPVCLFSLIFIYLYNGREGPKAKCLFYVFYPLQFLIFFLIKSYTTH
jgi:hypothetical protein